ncbi:syntaxin binding protein 1 [Coemansia spiralis]|nr:syntaxin binding protein 1 [Coemansia spiralis]
MARRLACGFVGIVDAIRAVAEPSRWRVVIADRPSLGIISSVLKMHTIMEYSVVGIQLITRSRQPYPDMDAVYILVPTADSVSRALGDFQATTASAAGGSPQRKYARAHLLFTGALSNTLREHLRSSPAAQYIRTVAQIFVEYNPIESRVFLTTPSEHPFYALYSPHALPMLTSELNAAADRVLSTVVSLGIRPYVRYYRPPPSAAYVPPGPLSTAGDSMATACPRIAEAMAARIQQKLDEQGQGRPPDGDDAAPSVILVLDRSVDLYAPLLHEFSYQAIVHDLIDLEGGRKYVYEAEGADGETRQVEAELTENTDELWGKFRHWHIADVSQALADEFETLVSKNESIQNATKGRKLDVRQMKDVLSGLPDFRRLQDAYSLHIDLASKCLDIINQGNLTTLSDFEQASFCLCSALSPHHVTASSHQN